MAIRYKIDRAFLRQLKVNGKYQEYSDQDLRGFGARVSPTGKITYVIRWVKPNRSQGRRVIGNFPETSPSEARDLAAAELRNVDKLGDTSAEVLERHRRIAEVATIRGSAETLGSYLDGAYTKYITVRYKSADKTIKRIQASFQKFLDYSLADISQQHIEDWRYQRRKLGLKNSTLEREVNALKGLFSRAVQAGVLAANPLAGLDPLPIPREGRVRWLSDDEEHRLRAALIERELTARAKRASANDWRRERDYPELDDLQACAFVDHLQPMVVISLNTGLRQGELLSLKWNKVDLSLRLLTVTAAHSKSSTVRHVPLNNEAHRTLVDWLGVVGAGGDYVFEGQVLMGFQTSTVVKPLRL